MNPDYKEISKIDKYPQLLDKVRVVKEVFKNMRISKEVVAWGIIIGVITKDLTTYYSIACDDNVVRCYNDNSLDYQIEVIA